MAAPDALPQFQPAGHAAWRQWLAENHGPAPGGWLVSYKKAAGRPRLTYDEAVEETLCFGWIDSLPRKLDAERTTLLFTPRKPKSGWSKVNKECLARLEAAGLLTPAGIAVIEKARQNGVWQSLDAAEAGLMPADLTAALATDETAARHFAAFSLSSRSRPAK